MFGKKGSKFLKLPPVRNSFTLAMTNKLVVIINSLKVPKIKKILLYGMKFLVPNYSCLQNPWIGGYCPQIPDLSVLCLQLNLLNLFPPSEQNSWVRHWFTVCYRLEIILWFSFRAQSYTKAIEVYELRSCTKVMNKFCSFCWNKNSTPLRITFNKLSMLYPVA